MHLITRNPNYTINNIIDGSINVADQGAEGVDTEVRWAMDNDMGSWQASLLHSYLIERIKVAKPGDARGESRGSLHRSDG